MQPFCCWHKDRIEAHECPNFRPGDDELLFDRKRRFLTRCIECHLFLEDLRRLGSQAGDLPELFPVAIEELLQQRARNRQLNNQIEALEQQANFLREVGQVLQSSLDRDEVIAMALTAITAGKGFNLNRAILLLADKERNFLTGYLAIGPRDHAEAGRIWQEIEERDFSLREMARRLLEEKLEAEREKFRDLLEVLRTPLEDHNHLFVRVLDERESRQIVDLRAEAGIHPEQVAALGVQELVVVPLISKQRRIGLLLADNLINGRPLEERDLRALETFASPVAYAIERAELYERLQQELERTTEANRRLKDQQQQILRMEKMALVGKLTADIAHSIRNPLTIIGGFARNLAKKMAAGDRQRPMVESIIREARRLEEALQEVLLYSESQHPTLDNWDLNQILAGAYAGIQEDLDLSGATVTLDLDQTLPPVRVDFKSTGQCLRSVLNLLLHAARPESRIDIISLERDGELQLVFSGTGLDQELLPETTAISPDAMGKSTGLGLALSARVLEGQNATLKTSNPLPGVVTITICIPLGTREERHATPADC